MKERTTRSLVVCVSWLALTTVSILAFPFSSASATTLTPQNSGHCLSVVAGTQELQDGARIEQRACTGASRQNWTLEDMGSGRFRAKVVSSGKCLEPVEDTVINGTGLEQRTCDGTSKQLWTRHSTATVEGTYRFVHVDANRCLDVPQQSTAEGVLINLWACHADMRPHQSWAIAQRAIAKHSDKCLDVRGGPQATEDGRVIDQWQCNEGAWNQFWTLRDAGSNQVRLVAQNSGKCIEPVGGGIENLTPLHQMTCSGTAAAQLWSLQGAATPGEFKLVHGLSNKCIDIKQSLTTDGADALLFTCKTTNEANQTFKIGTGAPTPPAIERTLTGEYWELPTRYPAKSPHGGLHQIFGSAVRWAPTTNMVYLGSYWRDVNPRENEYDWARFEERRNGSLYGLNEVIEEGKTGIIWISAFDFDKERVHETTGLKGVWHAPDWVRTKCGSQAAEMTVNGAKWGLPLWNDCPRQELVKFITAMFSRYRTNENVKYGYVTTLNSGEFFIPMDEHYDAAVANGFTPEKLEIFGRAVIDAWMTALGPDKVVWTRANDNWRLPGNASQAETPSRVNRYALLDRGAQFREGNAENFMANLEQPLIGQVLEPTLFDDTAAGGQRHWYLKAKTIYDMLPTPRTFYGEEFEIADKGGAPWFDKQNVFHAGNYPFYRLAVLNMLRKGQNWTIFPRDVRDGVYDQDPRFTAYIPLRNYFRQSAGYRINESPDAWATLHKTNDNCFNSRRHYHNYEKFLYQREVQPGGVTTATEPPHSWPQGTNGFCKPPTTSVLATTHFARRTDHASGNDFIYFDVDSAFAATTERRFRIAVTYQDTGTATWHLDYSTPTNALVATPSVANGGTPAVKTVIFSLSDASFRNAQTGGMDFRINNGGGPQDVVIRSVRVMRGGQ